ncbi:MAG: carboxynorspermidine decarboxylase [Pirellulales bacterium]
MISEPPATPSFVISEAKLLANLRQVDLLRQLSGAKVVLALKCFSTWGVFDILRPYLDGTTSSSVYEARLGHETLGGETHAYSVGFSADDVLAVDEFADKVIFNSPFQLRSLAGRLRRCRSVGLRINPEISYARQTLADPARECSRLGARRSELVPELLEQVTGAMFHFNCENRDVAALRRMLAKISDEFAFALDKMEWVSLGGGMLFTADGYPLEELARTLSDFSDRHGVVVYLEPGEAIVTRTTELIVTVLDIVHNGIPTAIVDSATEAHRLDTLIFNEPASIAGADPTGPYEYFIGASSCLAGDLFCRTRFSQPLQVGQRLRVLDSGGYTMVKLNWFNGLRMPSIYCQRLDGSLDLINEFSYSDFKRSLGTRTLTGPRSETQA